MITAIIFIIGLLIAINFLYFILPSLSPIPFFPTNKKDIPLITSVLLGKNAALRLNKHTIIDLGAGTGTVIFAAAREAIRQSFETKFIAVEIHPLLIFIMHLKRLFHPNKKNIHVIRADIFTMDYKKKFPSILHPLPSIYLYVGPFVMERLKKKLLELPENTQIVSYMYEIPGWKNQLVAKNQGIHPLFSYLIKL